MNVAEVTRALSRATPVMAVKVMINGVYVPTAKVSYDRNADVIIVELDEDHPDYTTALTVDEGQEGLTSHRSSQL